MYHEYNRLFVPSFCLSRLFRSRCFRPPLPSLLAPGIGLFRARLLYFRPRTKPLLRKTWATWCAAYVMGRAIRRITPRRLRACHLSGASIFERRCESTGCSSFFHVARPFRKSLHSPYLLFDRFEERTRNGASTLFTTQRRPIVNTSRIYLRICVSFFLRE